MISDHASYHFAPEASAVDSFHPPPAPTSKKRRSLQRHDAATGASPTGSSVEEQREQGERGARGVRAQAYAANNVLTTRFLEGASLRDQIVFEDMMMASFG